MGREPYRHISDKRGKMSMDGLPKQGSVDKLFSSRTGFLPLGGGVYQKPLKNKFRDENISCKYYLLFTTPFHLHFSLKKFCDYTFRQF